MSAKENQRNKELSEMKGFEESATEKRDIFPRGAGNGLKCTPPRLRGRAAFSLLLALPFSRSLSLSLPPSVPAIYGCVPAFYITSFCSLQCSYDTQKFLKKKNEKKYGTSGRNKAFETQFKVANGSLDGRENEGKKRF